VRFELPLSWLTHASAEAAVMESHGAGSGNSWPSCVHQRLQRIGLRAPPHRRPHRRLRLNEHMRAGTSMRELDRLDRVLPAMLDQRSAHEHEIGANSIELPTRRGCRRHRMSVNGGRHAPRANATPGSPRFPRPFAHGFPALGLPRHDHGSSCERKHQRLVRLEQEFLFARMGRRRDDDRTRRSSPP